MSDYKPIETHYNGYRFRSRLEARWAVFFDAVGIEYQYEQEGFEREYDGEKVYYLPDFYLPQLGVYAEVKGSDEALKIDALKLGAMIDWGGPLAKGVVILGNIPNWQKVSWANLPLFSFLINDKSVFHELCTFYPRKWILPEAWLIKGDEIIRRSMELPFGCCQGTDGVPTETTTKERFLQESVVSSWNIKDPDFARIKEAYRLAFQARFEHGETPKVKEVNT